MYDGDTVADDNDGGDVIHMHLIVIAHSIYTVRVNLSQSSYARIKSFANSSAPFVQRNAYAIQLRKQPISQIDLSHKQLMHEIMHGSQLPTDHSKLHTCTHAHTHHHLLFITSISIHFGFEIEWMRLVGMEFIINAMAMWPEMTDAFDIVAHIPNSPIVVNSFGKFQPKFTICAPSHLNNYFRKCGCEEISLGESTERNCWN